MNPGATSSLVPFLRKGDEHSPKLEEGGDAKMVQDG